MNQGRRSIGSSLLSLSRRAASTYPLTQNLTLVTCHPLSISRKKLSLLFVSQQKLNSPLHDGQHNSSDRPPNNQHHNIIERPYPTPTM
eukprot:scaffold543_cov106-Skeletonema_marinoi.AAC.6